MINIEKITTEYSEVEDRIRMSALTSDDTVMILWVTRRMLLMLIPPVSEWLDEKKNTSSQMSEKSKEMMNDFAQSEAQAKLKAEKPVTPEKQRPQAGEPINSWLIHEIDVKHSNELMELYFKSTQNDVAKLILTKLSARQWLSIVHSQWIKSEWLMDIWPSWFTQASFHSEADIH
ncbi:hypothetical protein N9D99_02175 [Gammaproteobacteria bacterium]|nr:hypothetical protein [Gammaproteobacteria bacterium]